MSSLPPRVTIAGLGLIGGSLGMALRGRGWEVSFLDPAVSLEEASGRGAADRKVDDLRGAHLVVIATPLDAALQLLEAVPADTPATSVCSVMQTLATLAWPHFVAGHPFAGSERRSLAAASPDLFIGRTWFLADSPSEQLVDRMVCDAGAEIVRIDPAEHDRALAFTSHLPQLFSTALASAIAQSGIDLDLFAGPGLRTFLRLAGSSSEVWEPVIDSNETNLRTAAARVTAAIERLLAGDGTADFERALEVWEKLNRDS